MKIETHVKLGVHFHIKTTLNLLSASPSFHVILKISHNSAL
jgi:hypothetical protein